MNQVIVKKTAIFSFILGAVIGLVALLPFLTPLALCVLALLSSTIVILYMKKDEKHLAYLTNEQGAIIGGIIGFFATLGFFVTFSPMVCIIHLIFKSYYAFTIPDMLSDALWLFFIIVFMVGSIFAMINSATGMGTIWLLGKIEPKPQDYDARLDIKIED